MNTLIEQLHEVLISNKKKSTVYKYFILPTLLATVVVFPDVTSSAPITRLNTWLVVFREEGSNETSYG